MRLTCTGQPSAISQVAWALKGVSPGQTGMLAASSGLMSQICCAVAMAFSCGQTESVELF
ncbi:hypothetical protein [Collimonas humicola]|uniref:hypothetical protein n=1 Tax=Collimonas humicola TaxID=2825886 RepID=UPI002E76DE72|nr:hypothetical protein [Collimonas humicola]